MFLKIVMSSLHFKLILSTPVSQAKSQFPEQNINFNFTWEIVDNSYRSKTQVTELISHNKFKSQLGKNLVNFLFYENFRNFVQFISCIDIIYQTAQLHLHPRSLRKCLFSFNSFFLQHQQLKFATKKLKAMETCTKNKET